MIVTPNTRLSVIITDTSFTHCSLYEMLCIVMNIILLYVTMLGEEWLMVNHETLITAHWQTFLI